MKHRFQSAAFQHCLVDDNVQKWANSMSLGFNMVTKLFQITRSYVWHLGSMTLDEIEFLHQKFLSKGFTEIQWLSFLTYMTDKVLELETLYQFCNLETSKLFIGCEYVTTSYIRSGVLLCNRLDNPPFNSFIVLHGKAPYIDQNDGDLNSVEWHGGYWSAMGWFHFQKIYPLASIREVLITAIMRRTGDYGNLRLSDQNGNTLAWFQVASDTYIAVSNSCTQYLDTPAKINALQVALSSATETMGGVCTQVYLEVFINT